MKEILSDSDKRHLEKRIADFEKKSGVQLVLAVTHRSGSYPEIPWKAFSVTVSLAALTVFVAWTLTARWTDYGSVLAALVVILFLAALSIVLAVYQPFFAKLFLSETVAEKETHQYAETLFLKKELFATVERNGILVLLSRFERRIVILPDKGLAAVLGNNDVQRIIEMMIPLLRKRLFRQAFDKVIDEIGMLINPGSQSMQDGNQLSDKIIEDKGL